MGEGTATVAATHGVCLARRSTFSLFLHPTFACNVERPDVRPQTASTLNNFVAEAFRCAPLKAKYIGKLYFLSQLSQNGLADIKGSRDCP